MTTLKEMEKLMSRTGAVIRAIPETNREVYENNEKNRKLFPEAIEKFVPEFKRIMLVVEKTNRNGGKFLLETGHNEGTIVHFTKNRYFENLSDIAKELRMATGEKEEEAAHVMRVDYECMYPGLDIPIRMVALFDDRDLSEEEAVHIIQRDPAEISDPRMVVMSERNFSIVFRSIIDHVRD